MIAWIVVGVVIGVVAVIAALSYVLYAIIRQASKP